MRRNPLQHLAPRYPLRPQHEAIARQMQHRAPVALQREQQGRLRRHPHLLVIPRLVQSRAALQQSLVELFRALCRRRKQWLRNRMQLIVQRIDQYHPGSGQYPGEEPCKCRAIGLAHAIALA